MLENIEARLQWCRERRHWTESENEMDKLDEEIRILSIIVLAGDWPTKATSVYTECEGETCDT
jgi:hypothetical protein